MTRQIIKITRKYRKSKTTKRGKSAKFVFGGLNPPTTSNIVFNFILCYIINGVYKALILNNKGTQLDVF